MFTFLSRFRRETAVLAVLALVASVVVAVPVSAADDPPKADFKATFSACIDGAAEDAGFTDVPEGHANAGHIDCIAYYGITKGTSATTYSPLASVTREHMALFLTRLAGLVGIEMVSDPDDAGFTDIGELSDESQTAINQLADLGITQGTSATTYSPDDAVQRDHMALFISRLMDRMSPMTDGDDEDGDYGYTPSDVVDNDQDKKIGSPFTDLGPTTKSAYDAITNLWELGVASGINDTSYGPSQSITRASMAGFMAGVLAHSNARPAGLSIQASKPSTFGANDGNVVTSVRDDMFMAVADQTVEIFGSDAGAFNEDGECKAATGACTWNDGNDERLTDESGNIVSDGGAARGKTHMYYAWIGSEDEEEFDADTTPHVSVPVVSMNEELAMKVTTSISKHADGLTADLDKGGRVTVTVQLVDTADTDGSAAEGAKSVARAGIEINVGVERSTDPHSDGASPNANTVVYNNTAVTTLTTDEDGKATFVVDAPKDDDDKDDQQVGDVDDATADPPTTHNTAANLENRDDEITFTYKAVTGRSGSAAAVTITIQWKEDHAVTTSAVSSAPAYVLPDKDGDLAITASMTLYDQYGEGIREGGVEQQVAIAIGPGVTDPAADGTDNVSVNRNGVASRRVVIEKTATVLNTPGTPIPVGFNERPTVDDDVPETTGFTGVPQNDVTEITVVDKQADNQSVQVVTRADDEDVGDVVVNALRKDQDEFLANSDDTVDTGASDLVYSYDSGDTFVNGIAGAGESTGELLTIEKFEEMLTGFDSDVGGSLRAQVDVVVYKPGGDSIFRVTRKAGVPG